MPRPLKYRELILGLLENNPNHPTVDWIHSELRRDYPSVSLATVYRTLNHLVADGALCELPFGTSESRFGLVTEQKHYHFICEKCHKILDLPIHPRTALEASVESETGHMVNRHTMEFYGVCRGCLQKKAPGNGALCSSK
ncbi:MAG: transcriptional repressor [Acidobacteriota bacterium]